MSLLKKIGYRVSKFGIIGAIKLIIGKSFTGRRRDIILRLDEPADRFTKIFKSNHWNSLESRSGEGSTFENTENIRLMLPKLLNKYQISILLDVPCGDFNWMRFVMAESSIQYIGGDIVQDLIKSNNQRYPDKNISFINLDLTKGPLPTADLLLCRDCLFHLSYEDIKNTLEVFLSSSVNYLLTTSSAAPESARLTNTNIITGEMRQLDLFAPPFNVSSSDVLELFQDSMISSSTKRWMILLKKPTVHKILGSMENSKY